MPGFTRSSETLRKRHWLWPSTRAARVMSGMQSVRLPVSDSVGSSSREWLLHPLQKEQHRMWARWGQFTVMFHHYACKNDQGFLRWRTRSGCRLCSFSEVFFLPYRDKLFIRRRKKKYQNIHPAHCYIGNAKTILKLLHLSRPRKFMETRYDPRATAFMEQC